jgi:hypothetical protein
MVVIQLINLDIAQILVKLLMNLHHADTNEGFAQDAVCILSQVVSIEMLLEISTRFQSRVQSSFSRV